MARVTRSGTPIGDAVLVEELNDPLAQDQGMTIRRDGRELIFWSGSQPVARPGGLGLSDIWVTTRRNGNDPWSTPQNIGVPVNSSLGDLVPVLSPDGRTLFFSSNTGRNGLGLGMTDIWMSTRAQDIGEEQHDDITPEEGSHRQCAPKP